MVRKILMAAVFSFGTIAVASSANADAEAIEKRQQAMKSLSAATKEIKGAVATKDYASIETKARDVNGTADKIVGLFPKGSAQGKTKATAAIWEKSDEFAKAAKNLSKASAELAAAAKSNDEAAVAVKVKELGSTCGACHKPFRAEKYAD